MKKRIPIDKKYSHIALGGTFDRFHLGHKYLIASALKLAPKVTIGVTSNNLARKLHRFDHLESFQVRKDHVIQYLKEHDALVSIVTLSDIYGTTVTDDSIDALIISKNTLPGALEINKQRKQAGKKELDLHILDLKLAKDGEPISSTKIRKGEITREGKSYFKILNHSLPLKISKDNEHLFKKPFGKTFIGNHRSLVKTMKNALTWVTKNNLNPLITVGDVVTKSALQVNGKPLLKIVDLHIRRKRRYEATTELGPIGHMKHYVVDNQSGTISKQLITAIQKALKSETTSVILVKGEEDLAVLPATILSPLHGVILYGHYKHGVIGVEVTEEKKAEAVNIVHLLQGKHTLSS